MASSIEIPEWVQEAPKHFFQRFYLPAPLVCIGDFGDRDFSFQKCMNCYEYGHSARECSFRGEQRLRAWNFDDDVPITDLIFRRNEEVQYLYSSRNYFKYRSELAERKTACLVQKIKCFADSNIVDCAHCPLYRHTIGYHQKRSSSLLAEMINVERADEILPKLKDRIDRKMHMRDTINNNFDERATSALNLIGQPWMTDIETHFDCKVKNDILKTELNYWVLQAIQWRDAKRVSLNDCIVSNAHYHRIWSFVVCNKCHAKGDHLPEDCIIPDNSQN